MRIFHGNKVKSIRNLIDISKGEIEYFVVVVSHLQWKLTWSFFGVHKMFLHVAVLSSYSHPICMFPTYIGVSYCTYHMNAFLCTPYMKNGQQFIIVGSVFVLSCTDFSSVLSIPSRRYIWDSISLSSQFFFINFGLSTFRFFSRFFSIRLWNKTNRYTMTCLLWALLLRNQPENYVYSHGMCMYVCTTKMKWELVRQIQDDHISEKKSLSA